MKIVLTQPEIEIALVDYVTSQGISLEGKTVTVDMTAGRKENGFIAEIAIDDEDDKPKKAGAKKSPKKEVEKVTAEEVEEVVEDTPPFTPSIPATPKPIFGD